MGFGLAPAFACSPIVATVTGETRGVFEQQTIAAVPSLGIRETRSASVVVRFWGEPPSHLGLQYHGGNWRSPLSGYSCGPFEDAKDTLRYGTTDYDSPGTRHSALLFSADGLLYPLTSEGFAQLEEWLGPPTDLAIEPAVARQARLGVWLPTILGALGLVAAIVIPVVLVVVQRRRSGVEHATDGG